MALNFPDNPDNGDTYQYQANITDPSDPSTILEVRDVLYTYSSAKDSWTGTITTSNIIADPIPSNVVATPPFLNAGETDAGTLQNPYQVSAQTSATPGGVINSNQTITFTGNTSGELILFRDEGSSSNTRFQQFVTICDPYGNSYVNLRYEDDPITTQDGVIYTAALRSGNVHFTWAVTQQVAQPINANTGSVINVTGNVWNVGQTAQLVPGSVNGGVTPYTYAYKWQRSLDTETWTDITNVTGVTYLLTEVDQGYYIRAVTTATDSTTPTNQTLELFSNNSSTAIQGPPRISEVALNRLTQSLAERFTDQEYVSFITLSNEGTAGNTKSIKVTFSLPNSTIRYGTITSAGIVTSLTSGDPGFRTTTQQSNINLKFPSAFTNGNSPDVDLPEGTTMITTVRAINSFGESVLNSDPILPEIPDVVAYPKPDYIGSELTQYTDPFIPDENPFNSGAGPLGSNKQQYGLVWYSTPTVIRFNPTWDVSSTPITLFQGGGAGEGSFAGINDFVIIFTDVNGVESSVVVNTQNPDWSAPISFSDYGFIPPTTIKQIVFNSIQNNPTNTTNGLVGFYGADSQPVIYETLSAGQTRLTAKKTTILNSL